MDSKTFNIKNLHENNLSLKQKFENERKQKIYYQTQLKNTKKSLKDLIDKFELAWQFEKQNMEIVLNKQKQYFETEIINLRSKYNAEINKLEEKISNLLSCNEKDDEKVHET